MVKPIYEHVKSFSVLFFVITNDTLIMGRGKNIGAEAYWERYAELSGGTTKDLAVALKAGVSTSTLSSWKSANRFPPANAAVKIAQFFSSTVEYMVDGRDTSRNYNELRLINIANKHQDILESLDSLDPLTLETFTIQIKAVSKASRTGGGIAAEPNEEYGSKVK